MDKQLRSADRERTGSLAVMAALAIALGLLTAGSPAMGQDAAPASPAEVKETFANRDFDRTRWTMGNLNVATAKADFSRGAMRLVIPPAPGMRPLIGLDSRFGLEGDFDISVDYTIRSLPKPEKEWTNVSIYVQGPDGQAAMTRTNDTKTGNGYSVWFQPSPESKAKGTGKNLPTEDKAGSLRLERVGSELRYSAAARGQPIHQIGAVEFGTRPVQTVGFHVLAPGMKAPVDVEFDNISVKADRFTGLAPPPQPGYGGLLWIIAASFLVLLGLFWWWRSRS